MAPSTVVLGACSLAVSAVLTGAVRRFALFHGVLDIPNDRSSHSTATPRGGGIAIVLTATVVTVILLCLGTVQINLFLALTGGGIAVAAVGFMDDRFTVPAGVRLAIHVAAAVWAVAWLGGLPLLRVGNHLANLGWPGHVLATAGIVWTLNLFNFMDGIDGIAASEAVFVTAAGVLLTSMSGNDGGVTAVALMFACGCAGFLLWNWPPAKIFMGDVGSGYLGYFIAVLALQAVHENPAAVWVWLILGALFFVDATVTLVRRTLRGERVHEAHRNHAYQWLARRWRSHRRVTLAALSLNLLVLLPCALFAALHPEYALWILLLAFAALVVLVLLAGSGRRESTTDARA